MPIQWRPKLGLFHALYGEICLIPLAVSGFCFSYLNIRKLHQLFTLVTFEVIAWGCRCSFCFASSLESVYFSHFFLFPYSLWFLDYIYIVYLVLPHYHFYVIFLTFAGQLLNRNICQIWQLSFHMYLSTLAASWLYASVGFPKVMHSYDYFIFFHEEFMCPPSPWALRSLPNLSLPNARACAHTKPSTTKPKMNVNLNNCN